jgi:hypothetical protein
MATPRGIPADDGGVMPNYVITVRHYLILETTITIHAEDRNKARQAAENMKERGTFGVIAWQVEDAYLPEGWTVASRNVEIETVHKKEE